MPSCRKIHDATSLGSPALLTSSCPCRRLPVPSLPCIRRSRPSWLKSRLTHLQYHPRRLIDLLPAPTRPNHFTGHFRGHLPLLRAPRGHVCHVRLRQHPHPPPVPPRCGLLQGARHLPLHGRPARDCTARGAVDMLCLHVGGALSCPLPRRVILRRCC